MKTKKRKIKAKKAKTPKRRVSELSIVNVKVNSKDRKALMLNAKRHAKGSLSAWLRHAGREYTPKKTEQISAKGYK